MFETNRRFTGEKAFEINRRFTGKKVCLRQIENFMGKKCV